MVQIFPYKFHNPQYKLHFLPVTRTKYDENSRMFETFRNPVSHDTKMQRVCNLLVYFLRMKVAASVAAFIVMVGWNRCDQLIHRLVSNRVDQIGSFCCLSAHLLGLDCVLAAVEYGRTRL